MRTSSSKEKKTEKLKKLLIVNHQRNAEISARQEINPMQIKKAIKENVLIVETKALLRVFELFKLGSLKKRGHH